MKRLLLIMNPLAGTKKANPHLAEIIAVFEQAGYECITHITRCRGDGTTAAKEYAGQVDLIVCIGGDGTFNETISGVLDSGEDTPIGYIPAGSTNDFAASLKLSKKVVNAAKDIAGGVPSTYDVGSFQNRYFTYVASFGAFTKVSYATSQSVKNALGHLAYLLGGIKELSSIRSRHVKFLIDGEKTVEGDYIFGAVSNSTSVGGILTLDPSVVDMNDGLFELLLIKKPESFLDLTECIRALTTQDYTSRMLTFVTASTLTVETEHAMDWTLDGEYAKGERVVEVKNLHNAVRIMVRHPARRKRKEAAK